MSLSRKQLYSAGEPIGNSATAKKPGGGYICGGGGDSSSSSSSNTNTTNVDKRQVVNTGGVGVSSDQSQVTVNNQSLDAGIVNNALAANKEIFAQSLAAVSGADASNAQGFGQLLTLADKLFTGGAKVLDNTSQATLGAVAALNTAQNDSRGAIDQKTMIALGVVGAVAVFAWKKG